MFMQLSFSARHYEIPDDVKEYADQKLAHLSRFFDGIIEVHLVLTHEKRRYFAELNIQANGITLNSKDEEEDVRKAIDLVEKKTERQLKKYKDKIKDHRIRTKDMQSQSFKVDVLEGRDVLQATEDGPRVVKSSRYHIKPMSIEEAAMQMDLIDQEFLAFLNADTERMNVLYRRKDGNYGLIEPE